MHGFVQPTWLEQGRDIPLAEAAYIKGLSVSQDDGRLHYMLAVTYNLQGKIALARDPRRE